MLKLIASDLDGTLLLPDRTLPDEIFPLIEKLYKQGILFCPASGRQYESLRLLFAPVADKVVFLAENGAYVVYKDRCIFEESLPKETLPEIYAAIATQKTAHPLLCCQQCAYGFYKDDYPPFIEECTKYYPHFKQIHSLKEIPESESVCKIAVFDELGSAEHSGKELPALLPRWRVIVSGAVWSDVSLPETNKGKAMKFTQSKLGISPDECMAFGDYMNDLELLEVCTHSFVTENGFPLLKQKIGRTVPSNAERGVIQKIKEVLGEM